MEMVFLVETLVNFYHCTWRHIQENSCKQNNNLILVKVKVKQSRYRPVVAHRVPGS